MVEVQIEAKGLPFLDPREEHLLGIDARAVMTPAKDLICFYAS